MRNTNEIITDLKYNIEWSQPNVRYNNLTELIKELEQALNSIKEITIPETPAIEETEIVSISEEPLVETVTTESVKTDEVETPTVEETVTPKKGRKPSVA
jgi:hypothetical protein